LLIMTNVGNCQKNTMVNTKDIRPLSFGALPVVFATFDKGPGLGLELNTSYHLTEKIDLGAFGRMKSLLVGGGSGHNEYGPVPPTVEANNIFALGATVNCKLFKAVSFQLRGGYEAEADAQNKEMIPRVIYGGGLIINFGHAQMHKIAQSLRFGIDFETDRTIDVTYPIADFGDFPYSQSISESNATIHPFSLYVGWNFQFHSIKNKR